jgi:hypothetical protein
MRANFLRGPSRSQQRRAAPPRSEHDVYIAARNSHVLAYDNASGLPDWLSDAFCRLATGGGFSTRELYTDQDEVYLQASGRSFSTASTILLPGPISRIVASFKP